MQDTPETLRNRPERNTQQQASVIYLIRNRLNGKSYVGQTVKTLQARWAEHIRDARKGSPFLFHRAIRKYGVEVFSESLLATAADQQELDALEISWITKLDTMSPAGYNTKLGKQGHPTEDVRQRISASTKGVAKSKAHAQHISEGKRGKPHPSPWLQTPEVRAKAANSLRKRSPTAETREKISKALQGRRWSPERRAKRRKPISEETREKLRKRKKSPESIVKWKASWATSWAARKRNGQHSTAM